MNNSVPTQFFNSFRNLANRRGAVFGGILVMALLAFEVFNYTTTDFALSDALGKDLKFLGIRWATILSFAFCAIDFAGIARLFTPQKEMREEPAEVWYLFGAWVLAAAMNAALTWWGVAVAISTHTSQGASLLGRETVTQIIPVFVAVMVWLIRILIIGTFSMAGERLFASDDVVVRPAPAAHRYTEQYARPNANHPVNPTVRPMPKPNLAQSNPARSEPSYHPVGMAAKSREEEKATWR